MRTKRTVSSRKRHSLKAKSGGGKFNSVINTDTVKEAPLILSCPEFDSLATNLSNSCKFIKGNVYFAKYGDQTPKVFMDELTVKLLRGRKVYFLAYFSFNESSATNIMDQYMFMCSLASYGILELNIVLPYFPTGTMERIVGEGELGTGYYLAHLLNSIPCGAYKNVLYVMDMHALCSRFFFHTNIRTVFITMMPKYLEHCGFINKDGGPIEGNDDVSKFIVFPDDGAEKRNKDLCKGSGVKFITCSKKRSGDDRTIEITGSIDDLKSRIRAGKIIEFYIVDDLVQTGGTLGETAKKLVETLHNEFSLEEHITISALTHIRTKCSIIKSLIESFVKYDSHLDDYIELLKAKTTKALLKEQSSEAAAAKAKTEAEAIPTDIVTKLLSALSAVSATSATSATSALENVEALKKALEKLDASILAEAAAEAEAKAEAKADAEAKAAAKAPVQSADAEAKAAAEANAPVQSANKCTLELCTKLKEFHKKKHEDDKNKTIEDSIKKNADILKEIVESCKSYSNIQTVHKNRTSYNVKFVINYVVTHSILPKTQPVDDIIKKVLFFQEYADIPAMVNFNYITTDSRPHVAKKLDPANIGSVNVTTGNIIVMPIANVLCDVLTNIDSPYIAPYIIPNA
jgi:phosphoribosylpyrophosphate synthetase